MAKKRSPVKKAARKAVKKSNGLPLVNFKISRREMLIVEKQAKKYTEGNVSAWLRYSATRFKPLVKNVRI